MEWTEKAFLRLTRRTLLTILALALVPVPAWAGEQEDSGRRQGEWLAVWGASPSDPGDPLEGQTIREHVRLSLGGDRIRVRLSNLFGTAPLLVGAVHVARHDTGAAIVPGTDRTVTFGGEGSVTIPAGALAVSDPIKLEVESLGEIAVSIYFPGNTGPLTIHALGVSTTYISPPGDFTSASLLPTATTLLSRILLSNVEVWTSKEGDAVVTLGDSITDGYGSTVDANHRWPDFLAERLRARFGKKPISVVDQGISGNRLRKDIAGPNAQARFDRDVIAQTGVRWVTLLEGINDIGFPGAVDPAMPRTTAAEIIAAYKQLITRAHAAGLKIYGCTLTPFEGTIFPGYFAPDKEPVRQAVNEWIRHSGWFDAVIDFDKVIRDPSHPTRMLPAYDVGDHLHPNDAGYKAMADAVDLRLFRDGDHDDD
jgi:lysophospholipase L1-like esterase